MIRALYWNFVGIKKIIFALLSGDFSLSQAAHFFRNMFCHIRASGVPTLIVPELLNKRNLHDEFGEYFYQDNFVARRISDTFAAGTEIADVGGRVDGLLSILAQKFNVTAFELRPSNLPAYLNISTVQLDVTDNDAISVYRESYSIVTCLHTIEHVGLGRYGDRCVPNAHANFFSNLASILKPGGLLFLSCPIGIPCILYNSHRIYSLQEVSRLFRDNEITVLDSLFLSGGEFKPIDEISLGRKYASVLGLFIGRRDK